MSEYMRHRLMSWVVLFLFGIFFVTSFLPGVFSLPAYFVDIVLYDSVFGLENVAYFVGTFVPISQEFLWEVGRIFTYYLAAIGIGWLVDHLRFQSRRDDTVRSVGR